VLRFRTCSLHVSNAAPPGRVQLVVDDWMDTGSSASVVGAGNSTTLSVGWADNATVGGLYGCLDEVFAIGAAAQRGELLALATFHRTLVSPSVGGAGYALSFSRFVDDGEGAGGFVELDGAGTAALLGYGGHPGEALTVACWVRPRDPSPASRGLAAGPRVPTFVIVDKTLGAHGALCPEFRLSLEAVPDRTGTTSALHLEVKVDVGARAISGDAPGWADSWPSGVTISHDGAWTFLAVGWNSETIQIWVGGALVVRSRLQFWVCLLDVKRNLLSPFLGEAPIVNLAESSIVVVMVRSCFGGL
jgi:hypothetical protein